MSLYSQRKETNEKGVKVIVRTDSFSVLIDSLKPNDIKIRGIHLDDYWTRQETVEIVRRYADQYKSDFKDKSNTMPSLLIECCEEGNIVRDGDHRLRALWLAQEELAAEGLVLSHVSVKEIKNCTDSSRKMLAWRTAESLPLSTIDQAELVKSMRVVDGVSVEEIAKGIGVSEQRIYQLLVIANLPDSDKKDIQLGIKSAKAASEAGIIKKRNVKKENTKALISCLSSAKPAGEGLVTITVPQEVYEALKETEKKDKKKNKEVQDV